MRPWKVINIMPADPHTDCEIFTGTEARPIASIATVNGVNLPAGQARKHADLIVRAVNNFAELLATLKNSRNWVEAAQPSQNKDSALLQIDWVINQVEAK